MSLKNRPTGEAHVTVSVQSALRRAREWLHTHLRTWPGRYVEMRVEALSGDDER